MKRVTALILFVPILYAMFLFSYLFVYLDNTNKQESQTVLQTVVNNAVDAAVPELLDSADLKMTYVDWGSMQIDPYSVLNQFVVALSLNLGYEPVSTTYDIVANKYVRLVCVCVYDGFYIATPVPEQGLVLSPKYPYRYAQENVVYGLNFNKKKALRLDKQTGVITSVNNPLDEARTSAAITASIVDEINYQLEKIYPNGWSHNIFIPANLSSVSGVNTISAPAVFAVVGDPDSGVECFGIGAAELITNRFVACYTEGGKKKYCYTSLIAHPESLTFEALFDSIDEAAEAGYSYDFERMPH